VVLAWPALPAAGNGSIIPAGGGSKPGPISPCWC